ncbi:MAG: PA0069 family radical SAM protein, partial [Hyphomicrobiales bacterium]|nr:PA0069 family radical SAM protein [Hyphomicrobiales bacterium]
ADRRRGRGALSNVSGRFETEKREVFDDGWGGPETLDAVRGETLRERPRRIVTRKSAPDLSFDRSVNPYRGCAHGCVYCYARPTHAYLGLSPGLDFETKLVVKDGAADLLDRELSAPGYVPRMIALGANTDPYQPIEREERVTRSLLEVLAKRDHPVGIVTKSHLVTRDLDILGPMAARGLAKVAVSVTTLDPGLARRMEPRAPTPGKRIEAIAALAQAGVPTTVLVAPVIPAINDAEIEAILAKARAAGATGAGFVMLRLPLELRDVFREWLVAHYPERATRALAGVRDMRGGKLNSPEFGARMSGSGPYAWMVARRFQIARARLGYRTGRLELRTDLFKPAPAPRRGVDPAQLALL